MEKVVIDIFQEYKSVAVLPTGETVIGIITNMNTIDAFLDGNNGLYTLYMPSTLPFATLRTISQKLGSMASGALLHASNEKSLLTCTGDIKIMNKLLKGD